MTLITLIIELFLSSEQITLTLSVQRPYLLTYSYDIALLYSLGCIRPIPTCRTLITLITLIIESFLSSEQITLTLSVQRPYLLTYSYDVVLLYSLGCIHPIPTCQTLITLITLLTESFLTIWTDNVQLPVNGPCKSRYLAINVICTTVLSLNIDYTDNRVVINILTDNDNAICCRQPGIGKLLNCISLIFWTGYNNLGNLYAFMFFGFEIMLVNFCLWVVSVRRS